MMQAAALAEIWRGDFLESEHLGHAVICGPDGNVIDGWGDPDRVILPRSSVKMIQALPLIESGAADAADLGVEHLALSCASHQGQAVHTDLVDAWLHNIGRGEDDLICGPQAPRISADRRAMIRAGENPCRVHNNCSGKHTGFLTLARHLGAGPDYVAADHPVQLAVREAFEDVTDQTSPGFGIDGCSAPNFAATLHGVGRAMAFFANAQDSSGRGRAARRLVEAMMTRPDLVAGQDRACTELMLAAPGRLAVKTGAEGVFVAILPDQGIGIALKAADGATRASECAIAALLVRLGVLPADHPAVQRRMNPPIKNWDGLEVGAIRPAPGLLA
ncbi:L-asparaginase [Actibacterium mucosum KCTC 23349]|uniref:L-asparaginase n=1 Tax=Actibacterium mucosum KCTC 23349 TaxID=1454373 RepID=A0A037ZPF8_9RHOB|nr:asparaginase [Actibacterium mucosum]KAJ57403.1 L-asparaginase [Actibacterium mucosum KCTC 23349]